MVDHNVTLSYNPAGAFAATPATIKVKPGQTIAFQLESSVPGTLRITFREPRFFQTGNPSFSQNGVVSGGDGVVSVVAQLSGRTTYHCELLDANGNVIAQSQRNAGGDVIPAS